MSNQEASTNSISLKALDVDLPSYPAEHEPYPHVHGLFADRSFTPHFYVNIYEPTPPGGLRVPVYPPESRKFVMTSPSTKLPYTPSSPSFDSCHDFVPPPPLPYPPPQPDLFEDEFEDELEDEWLFGSVGIHCYNLQNGTNLKHAGRLHTSDDTEMLYKIIKLAVRDRIHDSVFLFDTIVQSENKGCLIENKGYLNLITTRCRFNPVYYNEDNEDYPCGFDKLAVDDFFKGDMPNWIPEDMLSTASGNLQYYELTRSDMEEAKEWLFLYAEVALFSTFVRLTDMVDCPYEMKKVIVQTREDVEGNKKVKAENAIFYVTFKISASVDYKAIIRRTMDGTPEHMSLEVKCCLM